MRLRISLVLSLITLTIFFSTSPLKANDVAEKAAIAAAGAWLSLVDEGNYGESWNQAAGLFKNAITKEQWQNTVKAVRGPLGKVMVRKPKSKQYTKTLPGAPDGEYVIIQYETTFENKKSAIETVTPMLDRGGRWKISGYYIK